MTIADVRRVVDDRVMVVVMMDGREEGRVEVQIKAATLVCCCWYWNYSY